MLDGRRVLVTGCDAVLGSEIVLGLEDLGASASIVAATELGAQTGVVDVVVHSAFDVIERQTLAETTGADWSRRCEEVMRDALLCSQGAYALLRGAGGLLVFVTPTLGMTGAAELVPYASAVEGMRALAKSAARQWGGIGIRVNCVAPSAEQVSPGVGPLSPDVAEAALGATPAGRDAVASAIALLATERSPITGATVVVDGGVVMVP